MHHAIGNGRIIEGGEETELAGVNRDINNTQTITRDETHGGVDVRLNVDNDMLTNPGEYVQAVRDMPKNLKRAGRHVGNMPLARTRRQRAHYSSSNSE